jgi:hypothetical protein
VGWDLNPWPPKYKAGAQLTHLQDSACIISTVCNLLLDLMHNTTFSLLCWCVWRYKKSLSLISTGWFMCQVIIPYFDMMQLTTNDLTGAIFLSLCYRLYDKQHQILTKVHSNSSGNLLLLRPQYWDTSGIKYLQHQCIQALLFYKLVFTSNL